MLGLAHCLLLLCRGLTNYVDAYQPFTAQNGMQGGGAGSAQPGASMLRQITARRLRVVCQTVNISRPHPEAKLCAGVAFAPAYVTSE